MQLEPLESRTFLSAVGNTVNVPLHASAGGNLPSNTIVGHGGHLGRFTASFNDQGVLIITAANGDQLWAAAGPLAPTAVSNVFHVEGNYAGGTGRFAEASGAFAHDITFTNDQGDFVYEIDATITLRRPWNSNA